MVGAVDVVTMPQLGETVTEGTITIWSKAVGDRVEVDDALFEVSTEKVDTEIPSAFAGYLRAILVEEGTTVRVGVPVAVITETADETIDLDAVPGGAERGGNERDGGSQGGGGRGGGGSTTPVVTPVVRRLLDEHGIDPGEVVGTGRDGRITRADVLAFAVNGPSGDRPARGVGAGVGGAAGAGGGEGEVGFDAQSVEVGPNDEVVPLSRARATTAAHMRRSIDTAAHALVVVAADYGRLEPVRRAAGLSYLPFVARAVVDAIRELPHVNASFDGDRLVVHHDVNLGVAVDVDREALVVPVLPKAQHLRLRALAEGIVDLADRARRRRLPPDAFAGGTFTVTNVGSFGTVSAAPIINQPQVAILSVDGVRMTPVAVPVAGPIAPAGSTASAGSQGWAVAVHPVGNLSLSFDHRAVDGAYAAAFLARVRSILEERDWAGEVMP